MRVSMKVAPGVRVSGRVGGRHHRHHHHPRAGVRARGAARPRGPWLRSLPPWRMPVLSGGAIMMSIWLIGAVLFLEVWMVEAAIWFGVWCYYGLFLGFRSIYRKNVLGQTAASVGRRPAAPASSLEHAVDLAELGDWDGPARRRS